MQTIGLLVALCWFAFLVVWIISAAFAKKTTHRKDHFLLKFRIILVLIALFILTKMFSPKLFAMNLGITAGSIGVILCACGIGFAIWARIHLGRNWGMPMTEKENRELVTSGPYKYVRHPIYTGMFFALIGSGLATTVGWFVVLIVYLYYFLYSAKNEERMLLKEFPHEYAEYMKHTKMIIPFIY